MAMTRIEECSMEECDYNNGKRCTALAINLGGPHQMCDTFIGDGSKGGTGAANALVGACKVKNCSMNKDLMCLASAIRVSRHEDHPDCLTFRARA